MNALPSCLLVLTATVSAWALSNSELRAAEWGTLKGKFVLDGDLPKLKPLITRGDQSARDAETCAAEDIPDEQLVVDAETKGIANIVVYLTKAPAEIHPELKAQDKAVKFSAKGCRYEPHVLLVRNDRPVMCQSRDAVEYRLHVNPLINDSPEYSLLGRNITLAADATEATPVSIEKAQVLPVRISCDVHPWMEAWWVVLDHPYAAVTDAQGNFEIENLPVGRHRFAVWHQQAGYFNRHFEVDVQSGDNEVDVQKVPATRFKLAHKPGKPVVKSK